MQRTFSIIKPDATKRNITGSINKIIEDAKRGKIFVLVDDEGRENEGDLVIPAAKVSAKSINFI